MEVPCVHQPSSTGCQVPVCSTVFPGGGCGSAVSLTVFSAMPMNLVEGLSSTTEGILTAAGSAQPMKQTSALALPKPEGLVFHWGLPATGGVPQVGAVVCGSFQGCGVGQFLPTVSCSLWSMKINSTFHASRLPPVVCSSIYHAAPSCPSLIQSDGSCSVCSAWLICEGYGLRNVPGTWPGSSWTPPWFGTSIVPT